MRAGPFQTLMDDYARRMPWPLEIREVEARRAADGPARMREESTLLLAQRPAAVPLVALDPRGRPCSSEDLAGLLGDWRDRGEGGAAFAIGGADGHADAVRAASDRVLSFGPATFPHLLVRVMLAEQLYRAHSILTGHPYHRGD